MSTANIIWPTAFNIRKGRETRLTDRPPVCRLVLFQQLDPTLADLDRRDHDTAA